jgi:hypothetical protein
MLVPVPSPAATLPPASLLRAADRLVEKNNLVDALDLERRAMKQDPKADGCGHLFLWSMRFMRLMVSDAPRATPQDVGGPQVVETLAERLTACARDARPPDHALTVKAAMLQDVLGHGDTAQKILRQFGAAHPTDHVFLSESMLAHVDAHRWREAIAVGESLLALEPVPEDSLKHAAFTLRAADNLGADRSSEWPAMLRVIQRLARQQHDAFPDDWLSKKLLDEVTEKLRK